MDDVWQGVYDMYARSDLPQHQMSCWSKKGFEERFELFKSLFDQLPGVSSALDVGCGPGPYCRLLADAGVQVTGVDYAPAVVELAQRLVPQATIRQANGYALPFPDRSFDLVFSIGTLQCVEEYRRFVDQLCRTAKKYVIISTLRRSFRSDPDEQLRQQLEHDPWPTRSFHPDEITVLFQEAGFSTRVVTVLNGASLEDAFFVVAKR